MTTHAHTGPCGPQHPRTPRTTSCKDAAAANEAIRSYIRAHGSRPWGSEECAELARLRAQWLAAIRGKTT